MLILLIFLALVFFFIIKFTTAAVVIVAIVMGTTTLTTLACVWLVTKYYLKAAGYKPDQAREIYYQVDSDLEQIVGDLREIRVELEEAESFLRDVEFLRYARQNPKVQK